MSTLLEIPFVPDNFSHIANRILNYSMLMIEGNPHRICEIEFYLKSSQHRDLYVHGNKDQTMNGFWYFHKFNNGTYKNGTFKGLDIALGSIEKLSNEPICASILIRSIIDINQGKFIEGPCKTVNHILNLTKTDNIMTFTGGNPMNILENDKNLILVEGNPTKLEPILYGPRIGLSDKYPEFKYKLYRYVIGPVKKERKKLTPLDINIVDIRK